MPSEDRAVREKQLEAVLAKFEDFKGTLKDKGLDDKQAKKDSVYRKLAAEVKHARGRIKAIEDRAAHVEAVKQKATKAAKADKSKKKGAAQPAAQKKAKAKSKGKKK